MKNRMASKFAFKNIKANSLLLTPFLIAGSIMGALFFIMASLGQNTYVEKNQEYILMLIRFGTFIVGIFTFVFVIYANGFLIKRRNKEFALYGILGLEKKHIAKIVFVEYIINFIIISIFSVTGGYILGKLAFIVLNKATKNLTARIMDYYFSTSSVILTLTLLGITFFFIYLTTVFKIGKSTPIELLSRQKKAEGEPKSKFILGLLGFIFLCAGYYISITTVGSVKSFFYFLIAVILVIVGTYSLFMSFSIIVLKMLKRNRNLYYKAKNFLSISGMLYRMKSNAISLASITILSTSIIVTLASTLAINSGIKEVTESVMSQDFKIMFEISGKTEDLIKIEREKKADIQKFLKDNLKNDEKVKNIKFKKSVFFPILNENNKIVPLGDKKALAYYLIIETLEDYNKNNDTNYTLNNDEILYSTNSKILYEQDNLDFAGKNYKLIKIKDEIPKNLVADVMKIVVKDDENFIKMLEEYTPKSKQPKNSLRYILDVDFDMENTDKTEFFARLKSEFDSNFVQVGSKAESDASVYQINGGILFLGIIVALIFITGTVLITYYKQISEGFEDRKNYQIMKNVGLPDSIIKKSLNVQILWIFFLPLIIATIHSIFAFPILYNIVSGLGFRNVKIFAINFGIVISTFSIIYFIIYKITSRIYYKIVH